MNRLIRNAETSPAKPPADQVRLTPAPKAKAKPHHKNRRQKRHPLVVNFNPKPNKEVYCNGENSHGLARQGGVGKSMIAAAIAQYKVSKGEAALHHTDPVNSTFEGYRALNVQRLNIMDGDEINTRNSMPWWNKSPRPKTTSSSTTGPARSCRCPATIGNQVPALLQEMGHELVVHTVVTGGQAFLDTLNGFSTLARQFPAECVFVVWLNPYWGPIEHEGKGFEKMKAYTDNKARVSAIIQIPALKEETYGRDFSEMLQERRTFGEALADSALTIMTRQRLKIVKSQLSAAENAAVL